MSRQILPIVMLLTVVAVVLRVGVTGAASAAITVHDAPQPGAFPLVAGRDVASVVVDTEDHPVVLIAASCLADDVERVTGRRPQVAKVAAAPVGERARSIIVGSLDRSRLIRQRADAGKLDVGDLRGQWESFRIVSSADALVIVGSDRRGTAFGAFELSRAIGVSPWHWWADVPPRRREALHVAPDAARVGPPSVRYRGIFLNDEDWGLQPWAAKTFEREVGDIGPGTYAKIFELLLRLKANYCWPAMHDSTRAFNHFPQNKHVADQYAIVMGSSHAEPMLRNNVGEWPPDRKDDWNPLTNLRGILDYWEQRVRENGRFENTWTVGMRGIHDSGMPGGGTLEEKRDRMSAIIAAQREMLARHVDPDPSRVPQIFCPYKEVLDIYRTGLKLPEDVTIVWPDDNFGYVRQLANAAERPRAGRGGVYYHLSYWGRPHDYLWLESHSPALVWHEMGKAFEFGADRLWVANVGDIKPAESGMSLFLGMAWDATRYGPDVFSRFLADFYTEQFGAEHGGAIAKLKGEYFELCAIRKPEHLGWNAVYPNGPVRDGPLVHEPGDDEAGRLLDRWLELAGQAEAYEARVAPAQRAAYFQLVRYPACGAAALAEKLILAEKARRLARSGDARTAGDLAGRARAALARIEALTAQYNDQLEGKWRGMMDHRPRRLPVFGVPPLEAAATTLPAGVTTSPATASATAGVQPAGDVGGGGVGGGGVGGGVAIDAAYPTRTIERGGVRWVAIDGLSRRGGALSLFPKLTAKSLRSPDDLRAHAPVAEYDVEMPSRVGAAGPATTPAESEMDVVVEALPTQPLTEGHALVCGVSVGDGDPVVVRFEQRSDERDAVWQQNVLRGAMFGGARLPAASSAASVGGGRVTVKLWGADPSVVVQRVTLGGAAAAAGAAGAPGTYLGPRAANAR